MVTSETYVWVPVQLACGHVDVASDVALSTDRPPSYECEEHGLQPISAIGDHGEGECAACHAVAGHHSCG